MCKYFILGILLLDYITIRWSAIVEETEYKKALYLTNIK